MAMGLVVKIGLWIQTGTANQRFGIQLDGT